MNGKPNYPSDASGRYNKVKNLTFCMALDVLTCKMLFYIGSN